MECANPAKCQRIGFNSEDESIIEDDVSPSQSISNISEVTGVSAVSFVILLLSCMDDVWMIFTLNIE
jgi:hypothetical protein